MTCVYRFILRIELFFGIEVVDDSHVVSLFQCDDGTAVLRDILCAYHVGVVHLTLKPVTI